MVEYKSSSAAKAPSRKTRAIPAQGARKPIQLTDVPLKVNVARAPAERLNEAVAPLHPLLRLPCHHPAGCPGAGVPSVYVIDRSVFSKRVAASVAGGALDTVTVIGAEVVVLPAASRATAVSVWLLPLAAVVVSQARE